MSVRLDWDVIDPVKNARNELGKLGEEIALTVSQRARFAMVLRSLEKAHMNLENSRRDLLKILGGEAK